MQYLIERKKSVHKYNVEAFFLVILTSRFIDVERQGGELLFVIGKDGVRVLDTDATFEGDKKMGCYSSLSTKHQVETQINQ